MFLKVSVILSTGGGHAWLPWHVCGCGGGVHGCSGCAWLQRHAWLWQGGMHGWRGAYMVVGGHVWLQGLCMVVGGA